MKCFTAVVLINNWSVKRQYITGVNFYPQAALELTRGTLLEALEQLKSPLSGPLNE